MSKDYYQVLGIDKKASRDEIKKAFRKKAHTYHPDKKGGDEAKFKEANEAYTVLSNDKKRAEYDAYGRVFSGAGSSAGSGQAGFEGFDFSQFSQGFGGQGVEFDFGDIFGDFFSSSAGQGWGSHRSKRGRDISIDVEISFEESVFGTERKVMLTKPSTCDRCDGKGAEPKTKTKTCSTCNGQGRVHETRQTFLGSVSTVTTCKECRGTGSIPEKKCTKCKGQGVVRDQEEISVKIPAGIENGEMIRMTGAGESVGNQGSAGDLYIKVHVKPHATLKKERANLVMDLNVKLSDAVLGAKYTVQTLEGPIEVKIPENVKHGEILRVRGKGVPATSKRGDLMLHVKIRHPSKLSKRAKKLFEDLRGEGI